MYEWWCTVCAMHGTTITAVCTQITGSKGNLSTWKKGYMRSDYLLALAQLLNVSTDYLLKNNQDIFTAETSKNGLTKTLSLLSEKEIDDLVRYAEFLLSQRQVQVQPKD